MKVMMQGLLDVAIGLCVYVLYSVLCRTLRIREYQVPWVMHQSFTGGPNLICAHWHGDEWLLFFQWRTRERRMAVLTSQSRDGTRMNFFARLLGFHVFRGSSSRGGAQGMLGLLRAMKSGFNTSLAVDGPRGPRHVVKRGVVDLARHSGLPIVPIIARASKGWVFKKAWNKAVIPKPFSRVSIFYGPPIYVTDAKKDDVAMEKARLHLESQLNNISLYADSYEK